jgi:hypothetical protein
MRIWGVIGHANARKTSTIRALTGAGRKHKHWEIAYRGHGGAITYVHPPGLQEVNVSPNKFIQQVKAAKVDHVIVALRYHGARQHPPAAGYFRAFQKAGWNIAGHAVLGINPPLSGFGKGVRVPDAPQMPPNQIAEKLRVAWGIY